MCTAHTVHTVHTVQCLATILKCTRAPRCRLLTFVQCSYLVPSPTRVAAQSHPLWLISTSSIYRSYSNCNSMSNNSQICKSATLQASDICVMFPFCSKPCCSIPSGCFCTRRPMTNQPHAAPSHEVLMYFHNLSYTTVRPSPGCVMQVSCFSLCFYGQRLQPHSLH